MAPKLLKLEMVSNFMHPYHRSLHNRHILSKTCYIQIRNLTSPYPYRPGFGLGSMISPTVINSMKEEARVRSKIITYEQIYRDLEMTERELTLEKNQLPNTVYSSITNSSNTQTLNPLTDQLDDGLTALQSIRDKALKQRIAAYKELAELQDAQLQRPIETGISTFQSGIESPIDWSGTDIDYPPLADDKIQVDAEFYDVNQMLQSSSSAAYNAVMKKSSYYKGLIVSHTKEMQRAVHSAFTATSEQHEVESTLLLTAVATHKCVKQFKRLKIDLKKLINAWNYYYPNDSIDYLTFTVDTINKAVEEAKNAKDLKAIHMITQEYLGSAMVGMVHFIKAESTTSYQQSFSSTYNAMEETKISLIFASIAGKAEISEQFAEKMASSTSQTAADVKFDLICQGYMPKLQSNPVNDAIKEFAAFSPEKIDVSNDDGLFSPSMSPQEMMDSNRNDGKKQSNSGAMIKATIMGLTEAYANTYKVLDYETFMTAFDDYTKNATTKPGAGVPIGVNIKSWTKDQILGLIAKEYAEQNIFSGQLSGDTNVRHTNNTQQTDKEQGDEDQEAGDE